MTDPKSKTLYLSEIFESIQGETNLSGLMTSFLRLSGCPLRCSWCDSPYTFTQGSPYTFEELFQKLDQFGWKYVCITGGEPLLQKPIISFMQALLQKNYVVSLETSGALSTEFVPQQVVTIVDVKCPGSGMHQKNVYENLSRLRSHDQVKFVLSNRQDYDFAKAILSKYSLLSLGTEILFSPAWDLLAPATLVKWIKEDSLPVRLNLQIHKYIFGSSTRGV